MNSQTSPCIAVDARGCGKVDNRTAQFCQARGSSWHNPDQWAAFRPDVIGSVAVGHEGGAYTVAMYFISEQAAREGERKQPLPQLKAVMEQMNQLMAGEPEFLELRQPWLYSP